MVDVDDPQNFEGRLRRQLELLDDAEAIGDATREAIGDLADAHSEGRVPDDEQVETSSLAVYVRRLREAAEEIDAPLLEADVATVDDYLEELSYQYAVSTHNLAASALTKFGRYHGLGWDDSFEFLVDDRPKVDESRLFSDDEVNQLLEVGDVRDQAMVALFADTGCRVGALTSYRVRDVDLDGDVPQLAFNTNANTKRAEGKVLLSWSTGHIETYLSTTHPRPDDPNAPLIHKKLYSDDEDGACSPNTIRGRLKTLGEKAGIPRDRMKPHNFRHTAVSSWIRQGYDPHEIVHMASWADPSMLEVYDNVTDEQRNKDIAVRMGLVDDDEVAADPSDATIPCPRCDSPVRRNANFCPSCSLQMSRAPAFEETDAGDIDGVTIDDDPDAEPRVPDGEVWTDGAGDVLDEVPTDALLRKLLEREDIDPTDVLDG